MHALDDVGAVDDERLVALSGESAVVLGGQVELLEGRAHAAVVDDDAALDGFEIVAHEPRKATGRAVQVPPEQRLFYFCGAPLPREQRPPRIFATCTYAPGPRRSTLPRVEPTATPAALRGGEEEPL